MNSTSNWRRIAFDLLGLALVTALAAATVIATCSAVVVLANGRDGLKPISIHAKTVATTGQKGVQDARN